MTVHSTHAYQADSPYDRALGEGKKAFAAKKFDDAAKHFATAAKIGRSFGQEDERYAAALDHLGATFAQLGKYKEAELALTTARDIIITNSDRFHPDLLATLQNLGLVQRVTKQYTKATETTLWMLKIVEVRFGKDHLNVAAIESNLAAIEQQRGRFPNAQKHLTKALAIREKKLKPTDPVLAETYRDMGNTCLAQQKFKDAEAWYSKMLAVVEKASPNSIAVAEALQRMSQVHEHTKAFKKALPLIVRAHNIRGKKQGLDHVEVGKTAFTLSRLYMLTGDLKSSEPYSRVAMNIFKAKLGEHHPFHVLALLNHATLLSNTGRAVEAKQYKQLAERLRTAPRGAKPASP